MYFVIVDGMWVDKFFEMGIDGKFWVLFLYSIMYKKGWWGVFYVRLLIELCFGYVVIIVGFYEDFSVVMKGILFNKLFLFIILCVIFYLFCKVFLIFFVNLM